MSDPPQNHDDVIDAAQKKIIAGDFKAADTFLETVLAETPANVDALYMSAVCARYLKQDEKAADLLRRLHAASPEYGRGYQEQGHFHRWRGENDTALQSYRYATQYNPALQASWQAQAEILREQSRNHEARLAKAQADRIASLPKEIVAVMNHLHEGRLLKAESVCRAFLIKNPKHVEAMRLLAEIGIRFSVLEDAEFLLENAAEFEPTNIQVRLDYIKVLRKRQKYHEALNQAQALFAHNPDDPLFQSHLAIENMHNGNFERAFELFDNVLAKHPDDPATLTSKGHALKTFGRRDDAITAYKNAYAASPSHGDAYYGLANLKTYRFTDAEVEKMKVEESRESATHYNRVQLCFSLGKAFEDRKDFDAAFTYYERGNTLKRTQSRYDADQMTEEMNRQKDCCTPTLFAQQAGKGCPAPDPIFIVGLPRAGSTLLEQILASHSKVDGTLELPNILAMAHRLRRGKKVSAQSHYPEILHDLSSEQLNNLGEKYIEDTRVHRAGAPFFIDKMPNNFRHIGLINLILPNAKIIDARREPLACCFSGFKQLFAEGQEFTYGLNEIGRYYRDYVGLMNHWDEVIPGKILRVHYEDVIADLETEVRHILNFCGLAFEPSCIEFHKTERAVRTASSEQVRQPINTKGLESWRPFETHLAPLKDALDDVLRTYRM